MPAGMTKTMLGRNFGENRRITEVYSARLLGSPLSAGELELLARFREGLDERRFEGFVALYRVLLARYQERLPGTRGSSDFRRAVARHYGALVASSEAGVVRRLLLGLRAAARGYPVFRWLLRAAVLRSRPRFG